MSPNFETRRRRRTLTEIDSIIRQFRASGLSQTSFCRKHGLAASTFKRWQAGRHDGDDGTVVKFVPVCMPRSAAAAANFEVVFPNGLRLVIPGEMACEELGALLAAVAAC
jgi:hypothetical protein